MRDYWVELEPVGMDRARYVSLRYAATPDDAIQQAAADFVKIYRRDYRVVSCEVAQ